MNSRLDWIDRLKAFGIFFVILGHTNAILPLNVYIYSFHMPLFFFIAGYLLDIGKYSSWASFVRRKTARLLLPYLIFSLINYAFWFMVVRNIHTPQGAWQPEPLRPLLGILYSIGEHGWIVQIAVALWFLTCLFLTEILGFIILTRTPAKTRGLLVFSLALVGFSVGKLLPIRLPWSLDVALVAIPFYIAGYNVKTNGIFAGPLQRRELLWIGFLLPIHLGLAFLNGKIDMNTQVYHNFFAFYLAGFSGILFYVSMARWCSPHPLFTFIGKNTLLFLAFHGAVFYILRGLWYLTFKEHPPIGHWPGYITTLYVLLQISVLSVLAQIWNQTRKTSLAAQEVL